MTVKYYLGMEEVPYETYQQVKKQELEAGHGLKSSKEVDGYPEYTLEDGTVIRGDKKGNFNAVVDGKLEGEWMPGTENEWAQGEPLDIGEADFFFKVTSANEQTAMRTETV